MDIDAIIQGGIVWGRGGDKNKDDEFKIKITFTNDKGIPLSSDEDIYWYIEDNGTETSSENNNENEENNTSYAMPSFSLPSIRFFNKVYAEEGDIASGTYDGVDWRITPEGELVYGKQGEHVQYMGIYRLKNHKSRFD